MTSSKVSRFFIQQKNYNELNHHKINPGIIYPLLDLCSLHILLLYMQVHTSRREEEGRRFIKLESKGVKLQKFEFKTYELAFTVRQVVYEKIISFDRNEDLQFDEGEIREFLVKVLHEAETEIHYFIKNVFRYDYNNDGVVEYDELVNFCMEQHLGEIAIQRLHRQKLYSRGSQRQMNEQEFIKTIQYALSFLQFIPNSTHLESLFKSVDIDADGFISYQDYFRFLKEYFGSKSFAAGLVNTATVKEEMKHPDKKELDIVRKYSKYENGKGIENNSGGKANPKPIPGTTIKNNIINGGRTEDQKTNPNINQNNSAGSHSNGGMNGSSISNYDAKTIQNSNVSKEDQNSRDSDKKRKSSNQGIEVTIGKQTNKTTKDISLSEQEIVVASKIARLVLTQLKAILINYDTQKTLALTYEEIAKFFKIGLNFSESNMANLQKRAIISKERRYTYQQASKLVMGEFIAKIFSELSVPDWSKPIPIEDFVGIFDRVCCIVPNTPLIERFEHLYKLKVTKGGPFDYNQFQLLVCLIFNEYSFKQ